MNELDLEFDPRVPVLGCVSRLTPQKGFELLPDVLPIFLQRQDMRLVVLGSGAERHEQYFEWLQSTFPSKVRFWRGYNEALSHRIEAGADLFLMPSLYEPCGLNQLYSLRYGTPPLVRRTGGLADTVQRFDPSTGQGTGFVFDAFDSEALFHELDRALEIWQHPPLVEAPGGKRHGDGLFLGAPGAALRRAVRTGAGLGAGQEPNCASHEVLDNLVPHARPLRRACLSPQSA